ncbi:MAG: putative toxin-antitoxin system toxin component, PIN family [Gemmatimonadales bacterium]|nr:putative toxin-antitoxin system toxin component, PIN family [Gemmatimonadales bacterium]
MARRVVLDTNVLVAALRSQRGASAAVLRRVGTGQFEFCLSVALLLEYESVLKRRSTGITLSPAAIADILDYLAKVGQAQEIFFLWRPILPDSGDDHVLEVAVAGRCDTIVTFNRRDFRGAEKFGLVVAPPAAFLTDLQSEES